MPEYTHSHASEKRIADLVRQLVFGLGHGVLKETPPENLQNIVEMVHKLTTKRS